ncbi:DHCW motif cupin fold protein [Bradyrhizobium sp. ORS 111]|uniref:DHCW motif cupin fold protein n=1 Tax=Bradyrhizobium sp. ORS 111 TaxID=1685958 RepID=UPI0038904B1B
MKIPTLPFTITDWSKIEPTVHPGETGQALWRTLNIGDLRVRMVEYSPDYLADHWCDRGHVLFIVKGENGTSPLSRPPEEIAKRSSRRATAPLHPHPSRPDARC